MNSTLIRALPGLPEFVLPANLVGLKSRLFELRTYEQPTLASHAEKARMFADEEATLLDASGFHGILYGTNILGDRLPSLTYMWVYKDLAERQRAEETFFAEPTTDAFFRRFPGVPSAISNRILRPLDYSPI